MEDLNFWGSVFLIQNMKIKYMYKFKLKDSYKAIDISNEKFICEGKRVLNHRLQLNITTNGFPSKGESYWWYSNFLCIMEYGN